MITEKGDRTHDLSESNEQIDQLKIINDKNISSVKMNDETPEKQITEDAIINILN